MRREHLMLHAFKGVQLLHTDKMEYVGRLYISISYHRHKNKFAT
jgi:hypothetical protein